MKKHIQYPKIGQFRNAVDSITLRSTYIGEDKDGNPIYDDNIKKPILIFNGTVKLHGTNGSICYNPDDGLWIQSRNNIITYEKDNAGFASFIEANKKNWLDYLKSLYKDLELKNKTISIYGEWAGKGIQKGVAISNIERSFYIFGLKISDNNSTKSYWLENYLNEFESPLIEKVYYINGFKNYEIKIDFNNPELSIDFLLDITNEVEAECPVAKYLGNSGVGEGVVWICHHDDQMNAFKVKGEKHSITKAKKLISVDTEKLKTVREFIEYSVTENRVEQGIKEIFKDGFPCKEKTGDIIKWVSCDILEEEKDTLLKSNLTWKDVSKSISSKARIIFFNKINL